MAMITLTLMNFWYSDLSVEISAREYSCFSGRCMHVSMLSNLSFLALMISNVIFKHQDNSN